MLEDARPSENHDPRHPLRLEWSVRGLGPTLKMALSRDASEQASRLRERGNVDLVTDLARLIMERADPTSNKRFTPWLVREYAAGRLIIEDLATANETLTLFQRYAPRLKAGQRDIQRYGSLAAAWEAVRGFAERDEAHSNKAQKALDRARAYEESRILRQDPDGFTVAVPLTEFAAKWWGRGTRWCTAAKKDNAFWNYHQQAPLIVIVIPELGAQGKFQLWATANDVQFMDAADTTVPLDVIDDHWERFLGLVLHYLCQGFDVLPFIPENRFTEQICRLAVEHDGFNLFHVPDEFRTDEICLKAVEGCGYILSELPRARRTANLCKVAIAAHAGAFQYVPPEIQTAEMCRAIVMKSAWNVRNVSEGLLTEELCKLALGAHSGSLEHIPHAFRTEEICEIAVRQEGKDLQYVPLDLRSLEICRVAVAQDGTALQWVPEAHKTEVLCKSAIIQEGQALMWVPEHLRTAELCGDAVAQNGDALRWVPFRLRTMELCMRALSEFGGALASVPERFRTYEICEFAVRQSGFALRSVPKKLLSDDLLKIAVMKNGMFLENIPKKLRNKEICKIAVEQAPGALRYVPKSLRTEDICKIAVAQDETVLFEVPEHLRDRLRQTLPDPVVRWKIAILDEIAYALSDPTKFESAKVMCV